MEYLVWINPDEYDQFMKFLGEHGFYWRGGEKAGDGTCIIEKVRDKDYATTYYLECNKKELSYFPLDIYDVDSPLYDPDKFEKYKSECKSCEWIIDNILNKESDICESNA